MMAAFEVEEIARFLRRFSDLMSNGHNADHLLRAANLIEMLISQIKDAEAKLREEQLKSEKQSELQLSTEINCTSQEKKVMELQDELAMERSASNLAAVKATTEAQKLLDRAKKAEAQLASVEDELAETRFRFDALDDTHVLIPISVLQQAGAQFNAVARNASDFVSQVMCEVGASTLERAILESVVHGHNRTSKQAA